MVLENSGALIGSGGWLQEHTLLRHKCKRLYSDLALHIDICFNAWAVGLDVRGIRGVIVKASVFA